MFITAHPDDPACRFVADDDGEESVEVKCPDRSYQYRAAVEVSKYVNVDGLCRLWNNWRDSPHLTWMLHGWMMATSINTDRGAWHEVDFLCDVIKGDEK